MRLAHYAVARGGDGKNRKLQLVGTEMFSLLERFNQNCSRYFARKRLKTNVN
jgi:hypothetical protein